MTGNQRPSELSADRWIVGGRIAAALSLILFGASTAILSLADPPSRCPAWHLSKGESLWHLVWGWTLPMVVFSCVLAIYWKRAAEAALKGEERPRSILFGLITVRPPPVPVVYVIVRMCAMSAVISTFPLSLILLECGWPFSSGRGVALVLSRSESGEGHERLSSALESQVVVRSA